MQNHIYDDYVIAYRKGRVVAVRLHVGGADLEILGEPTSEGAVSLDDLSSIRRAIRTFNKQSSTGDLIDEHGVFCFVETGEVIECVWKSIPHDLIYLRRPRALLRDAPHEVFARCTPASAPQLFHDLFERRRTIVAHEELTIGVKYPLVSNATATSIS